MKLISSMKNYLLNIAFFNSAGKKKLKVRFLHSIYLALAVRMYFNLLYLNVLFRKTVLVTLRASTATVIVSSILYTAI